MFAEKEGPTPAEKPSTSGTSDSSNDRFNNETTIQLSENRPPPRKTHKFSLRGRKFKDGEEQCVQPHAPYELQTLMFI